MKIISIVSLAILFSACGVSTRVTSLVDPAYKDSSYSKLLVIGNYPTIEMTQKSEKFFVRILQDSGIFAISNSEILPPLRKYSDSEISVIYKKYRLDACMIISPVGDSSERVYIPGTTMANADVSRVPGWGTTASASVMQSGGTNKKISYINTRAELRDIRTGAVVSRCETNSEKTDYDNSPFNSSSDDLMRSISEKMVAEFKKNNLLRNK